MDKPFNPFNSISHSQSGLVKWVLLSLLVVAAFALTWFYPDIKNKLSPATSGEDMAGKKPPVPVQAKAVVKARAARR